MNGRPPDPGGRALHQGQPIAHAGAALSRAKAAMILQPTQCGVHSHQRSSCLLSPQLFTDNLVLARAAPPTRVMGWYGLGRPGASKRTARFLFSKKFVIEGPRKN